METFGAGLAGDVQERWRVGWAVEGVGIGVVGEAGDSGVAGVAVDLEAELWREEGEEGEEVW
jgi:hypothetical protein